MEAPKGTLQDLHDPRQHHAYADESEHDDANSPQEVLRRVEQAQQGRPRQREHRETDHKIVYREGGMKTEGEATARLLGVTACAPRSRGEKDEGARAKHKETPAMNPPSSPTTTRLETIVPTIFPSGPFVIASLESGSEPSTTGIVEQPHSRLRRSSLMKGAVGLPHETSVNSTDDGDSGSACAGHPALARTDTAPATV